MKRSSVARSAQYGQACQSCTKAKCRCLPRVDGDGCERCCRLKKACQPGRRSAIVLDRSGERTVLLESMLRSHQVLNNNDNDDDNNNNSGGVASRKQPIASLHPLVEDVANWPVNQTSGSECDYIDIHPAPADLPFLLDRVIEQRTLTAAKAPEGKEHESPFMPLASRARVLDSGLWGTPAEGERPSADNHLGSQEVPFRPSQGPFQNPKIWIDQFFAA
ncbi:hypothetical protein F5Y19DRAFT_460573 [Xylariaceae sp. FL1651]|nr:hypothetical protein F5Y19DRAFT_460573 [Xylariaceae sp. FL1651]